MVVLQIQVEDLRVIRVVQQLQTVYSLTTLLAGAGALTPRTVTYSLQTAFS